MRISQPLGILPTRKSFLTAGIAKQAFLKSHGCDLWDLFLKKKQFPGHFFSAREARRGERSGSPAFPLEKQGELCSNPNLWKFGNDLNPGNALMETVSHLRQLHNTVITFQAHVCRWCCCFSPAGCNWWTHVLLCVCPHVLFTKTVPCWSPPMNPARPQFDISFWHFWHF